MMFILNAGADFLKKMSINLLYQDTPESIAHYGGGCIRGYHPGYFSGCYLGFVRITKYHIDESYGFICLVLGINKLVLQDIQASLIREACSFIKIQNVLLKISGNLNLNGEY